MEWDPAYVPPLYPFQGHALSFPLKTKRNFPSTLHKQKVVFIDLWNTVPQAFIFTFVQYNQKMESGD